MATLALGAPYRRLWSATLLSNLGDGIRSAAFPLLAVSLTHSPVLIAGVAVAGQLPGLLFGLTAGSLADRFDRRRLVVAVDVVRLALLAGLIGLIAGGWATIGVVYLVVFVSGVAEVVRDTTAGTLVPSLVGTDQLDRANGRLVTAEIAGNEFVGPPLGGYLFGIALVLPFAVNGGTLAVAVALVAGIPALVRTTGAAAATDSRRRRSPIGAGLRWLRGHRTFWPVPATSIALAMTDSAWFTLLVLYVHDVLRLSPAWYGILLAVGALGGLSGGLVAASVARRFGATVTTVGCLALAAAGQVALGTTGSVAVTATVLATSSMAFAIWNVQARTTIQRSVPADLLGRVTSINRTAITAASVAGAGLGGFAAHHLGLHAPFLLGLPVLAAAGLLVAAGSVRRPRRPGTCGRPPPGGGRPRCA
jgi:MFS family permease